MTVLPTSNIPMSIEPQMNRAAVSIPEKLFFKIGEVCDIVGIQAHVLRYWESEFPMLAPQKNRAGQRTYRKRDVEMVLRIKELLYDEMYTIPGARKRLAADVRGASKLKVVTPEMTNSVSTTQNATTNQTANSPASSVVMPSLASHIAPPVTTETSEHTETIASSPAATSHDTTEFQIASTAEERRAVAQLRRNLMELLKLLNNSRG